MAITKIKNVTSSLDVVIDYAKDEKKTLNDEREFYQPLNNEYDYITNKDKTEYQYYVSGINCVPDIAVEEMICTKKQFGKIDKNLAYHVIQSFVKDEVSPDIAHEIGVKLATELFGDKYEVVVTTHLNTEHLHNHIIFNSVSFVDGEKYNDCHATYALIRETNDNLCREYGLNVLKEKPTPKANINYQNFMKSKYQNSNYFQTTKSDVDRAIGQAYSYKDFENILGKMGYKLTYRANKLSVCREGYKRNIRIERAFGTEYTIDRLKERIITEKDVRVPFHNAWKRKRYYPKSNVRKVINSHKQHRKSYCRFFIFYRYQLRRYKSPKYKKRLTPKQREEIKIMNKYSEEIRFLSRNKIHSAQELFLYKKSLKEELGNLESQLRKITSELKKVGYSDEGLNAKKYELKGKIKYIKSEVEICKDIENRIPMMKEQLSEELNKDKQNNRDKEVDDIERSRRGSR